MQKTFICVSNSNSILVTLTALWLDLRLGSRIVRGFSYGLVPRPSFTDLATNLVAPLVWPRGLISFADPHTVTASCARSSVYTL